MIVYASSEHLAAILRKEFPDHDITVSVIIPPNTVVVADPTALDLIYFPPDLFEPPIELTWFEQEYLGGDGRIGILIREVREAMDQFRA